MVDAKLALTIASHDGVGWNGGIDSLGNLSRHNCVRVMKIRLVKVLLLWGRSQNCKVKPLIRSGETTPELETSPNLRFQGST